MNSAEFTLRNDQICIRIGRQGGAILSADYLGTPFLLGAGGPDGSMANFPLVPFGNRVEANSFSLDCRDLHFRPNSTDPLYLHGDGWLGLWTVEHATGTDLGMTFAHAADALSPYDYRARQVIEITGNRLTLVLSVENRAEIALPFGLGQHPFFPRTSKTTLEAKARQYWTERPGHLPEERQAIPAALDFSHPRLLPDQWVNNAFEGWRGRARIVWPELGMVAEIEADPVFGHYMLYMPTERTDFFCFEPMTHLPNGHHMADFGGLSLLASGESLTGRMSISLDPWPSST